MAGWGYYGKISGVGDFLRHGLPPAFVTMWDDWLQAGLTESRARLGARWLDLYLTAPIWRFALAPGLAARAPMVGVMMPSVDRVGRHFPLTVVAAPETGHGPFQALAAAGPALDRIESAALSTLDDDAGRETLDAALSGIEVHLSPAPGPGERAGGLEALPCHAAAAAASLADRWAADNHGTASVWSARIDGDAATILSRGLPSAQDFARFLAPATGTGSDAIEEILS